MESRSDGRWSRRDTARFTCRRFAALGELALISWDLRPRLSPIAATRLTARAYESSALNISAGTGIKAASRIDRKIGPDIHKFNTPFREAFSCRANRRTKSAR